VFAGADSPLARVVAGLAKWRLLQTPLTPIVVKCDRRSVREEKPMPFGPTVLRVPPHQQSLILKLIARCDKASIYQGLLGAKEI
jgi:hypothetical protein